jgi:MFS family permease
MTSRPVFAATILVWPLLAGMALLMLGNGLQGTLLGVRATMENFPAGITGLVMAGYFLGFLAGSLLVPGAIARVGHLRVFAALNAFASVAILIHSVFLSPWIWGAMRLVTGFSFAGLYIVAESWLNDRVTNEHRGGLLSVYMIVTYVGMAGGQLLLNLADPAQHEPFILVSVVVSLASVPILLMATQPPEHGQGERIGALALLRVSRLASIGCFATGVAQGALFAMTAVYGAGIGLSVAEISLLLTALIAGGALAQWPIGWLSDRIERRVIITATAFAGAAGAAAAAPLQSLAFPALLAAMAVVGASALTLYSLFNAHILTRTLVKPHSEPRRSSP